MPWYSYSASPGFPLYIEAGERGILRVLFDKPSEVRGEPDASYPAIGEAARQLTEYFAGERRQFDLPLDLRGTPFQLSVWQALLRIPYGETRTYAQLAALVGRPGAARAVGAANGASPVSIIVPCHRVIATGGGLGGYGGGLDRKRLLLGLESRASVGLFR